MNQRQAWRFMGRLQHILLLTKNGIFTMNADTDIQVWLETVARTQPSVIVPYVRSNQDATLRYRVRTVKEGKGGRSLVGQGGTVEVIAGVPKAVGRMSVSYGPQDQCSIDLTLVERAVPQRHYHFECPKQ